MSQLPVRSLRLRSYTTADLDRLSGDRGAVFYDGELKTLKIYNGPGQTASSVAVIKDGARLELGTTLGVIYANQTTGQITIGDYLGPNGAPAAPSTVISLGGATNVFQISSYGPPSRTWTFGKNGSMTFPDATVQTTAWTGVADYRNLTNKPEIPEAYSFSVAADDSTQRAISNNELIKFVGAGTVTTASDAEGNITITGAESDRLSVTGSSAILAKDQYDTTRLTFTGGATIETAGYLSSTGGLALVDSSSQQYVIAKSNRVQITTGFPDQGTGLGSYNEWWFQKNGVFLLSTTGIIENNNKQWTFGTTGTLTIPGDIRSEGNINIEVNLTDSTLRRWQFGEDGELTVPGPISGLGNNKLEFTANLGSVFSGSNGNTISIYADDGDIGSSADINIYTDTTGNSYKWTFDTDGNLTIPGDVKSEGNINIDINLSDSTLRRWRFGEDGQLTFPDGTNQTTAFTGIPGPYADDAAAASAGVAVGSPYYKTGTGGQVFVRLS